MLYVESESSCLIFKVNRQQELFLSVNEHVECRREMNEVGIFRQPQIAHLTQRILSFAPCVEL